LLITVLTVGKFQITAYKTHRSFKTVFSFVPILVFLCCQECVVAHLDSKSRVAVQGQLDLEVCTGINSGKMSTGTYVKKITVFAVGVSSNKIIVFAVEISSNKITVFLLLRLAPTRSLFFCCWDLLQQDHFFCCWD
jgi:hypothetical protein